MIWFWHYLIGYLKISIHGDSGEMLLNNAAKHGIKIWNLCYSKGTITGNVFISDFDKLRYIRHGTDCKIKILKRHGIRFYTEKYKNRIGFMLGIILFSVILYVLSGFIWVINVEGNANLTNQEIITSCKKIGIFEGIKKSKINNKYDSQKLQLIQDGIAWCSLNIEGSVLTVNLSETTISDKEDRKVPSNLKASFDGKIKKIDVTSGNTMIKVGDTVSKGDLLVSGVIENLSSTLFVHSDGVVIAETKRTFSAQGDFLQKKLLETSSVIKRFTVKFFKMKLPLYLGNIKKKHNYEVEINNITIFENKIPIKIACEKYIIQQKSTVTYDRPTLEKLLYKNITKEVEKFNFIEVNEIKKNIIETERGILLNITYKCEENIAKQDIILLDTEN